MTGKKLKTLEELHWFELDIDGEPPNFEVGIYERCGCDEPKGEKRDIMMDKDSIENKRLVRFEDLKQEAIKWIKELQLSINRWKFIKDETGRNYLLSYIPNSTRETNIAVDNILNEIIMPNSRCCLNSSDIKYAEIAIITLKKFFNILEEDLEFKGIPLIKDFKPLKSLKRKDLK